MLYKLVRVASSTKLVLKIAVVISQTISLNGMVYYYFSMIKDTSFSNLNLSVSPLCFITNTIHFLAKHPNNISKLCNNVLYN